VFLMKKIAMVVDDDKVVQLFLKTILEDLGYEIIFASNGREATSYFRSNISLITMDHNMAEMSGIDATIAIRKRENAVKTSTPVHIVGITSHDDEETLAACRAAGMNQVFTKPVVPELLKVCFAQL
jgi:two-component system, CAI-1 autoinducer sensor kinase/phosphatase CqsS